MTRHSNIPFRDEPASDSMADEIAFMHQKEGVNPKMLLSASILFICMLCVLFLMICSCQVAHAYSPDYIANAIYKTENSKSHPYGIMVHYKHTSPRTACLNTIKHRLAKWDGKGDFIVFLGKTYSPPAINPNWVRLVKHFLRNEIA